MRAEPVIYSTAEVGTLLVRIDFGTGETKVIGPTGWGGSLGLAYSPEGKLYTVTDTGRPPANGECYESRLGTVDSATGAVSPYGEKNNLRFMGLTFGNEGQLYGAGFADGALYTIDLQTGAPSKIGELGDARGIMDLAMDPNGHLYGIDHLGAVFQIDPKTARATLVAKFSQFVFPMGLAFEADGTGYVVDFAPSAKVYRINLTSGEITGTLETSINFLHSAEILTSAQPRLTARREADHLVISWSNPAPGYALQATDRLGLGASWQDLDLQPTRTDAQSTVTVAMSEARRFFRLIQR
jgi:DNA-binding beta-propeller fold protein YncE